MCTATSREETNGLVQFPELDVRLDVAMAGSLSCADCIEALRRHADSFMTVLDGDIMEQLLSQEQCSRIMFGYA